MKKNNPFKYSALALLLGFAVGSANGAELVDVSSFELVGDIVALDQNEQLAIATALEPYQGQGKSLESLQQARAALEKALADLKLGPYQVVLPEQKVVNGNVFLQLFLKADENKIVYKGTKGYAQHNVENSLPSLKLGKTYEDGRQWFDKRELNMALENPLKVTRIHYDIDPVSKASGLTVSAFAPYENTRNYVAVDNHGSKEFSYARLTFGHINGNLTGRDDVLTLTGLTNFRDVKNSYALGLGYTLPFYEKHQSIGMFAGFSNLKSSEGAENLPTGLSNKISQGKNASVGFNWSYYLPEFGLGVRDSVKFNAGYLYRHYNQSFEIGSNHRLLSLNDRSKYSVGGGYIGFSGEVEVVKNGVIGFDVSQHYYSTDLPGSNNMGGVSEFQEKDRRYQFTRYNLSYNHDFESQWNFSTEIRGQYSDYKLAGIERESITGVYNVRGFRYAGGSGDKTFVWRTQIATPRYTNAKVRFYSFYDWGKFSNNGNSLIEGTNLSSAGVGLKSQMQELSWDVFVARRLHNHDYDRRANGKVSDRTSVWIKAAYNF